MFARNSLQALFFSIAVTGLGTAALSDGMPRGSLKDAPVAAAPFSWTGAYAGVNAGYSWGDADTDTATTSTVRQRIFRTAGPTLTSDTTTAGPAGALGGTANADGWLGGAQIGYNKQLNNWVLGVETDFQWTGEKGSMTACASATCATGTSFVTAQTKLDWFGSLRARAGLLIAPTVLLYATGGLAYGHVDTNYTTGLTATPGSSTFMSDKSTKAGWIAGGGVEAALNRNWLIRAEYLYMDLGEIGTGSQSTSSTTNLLNTPSAGSNTQTDTTTNGVARTHFVDQVFRVGLNYKFN